MQQGNKTSAPYYQFPRFPNPNATPYRNPHPIPTNPLPIPILIPIPNLNPYASPFSYGYAPTNPKPPFNTSFPSFCYASQQTPLEPHHSHHPPSHQQQQQQSYEGSKVEPDGARGGTGEKSSLWSGFPSVTSNVVKAVPKVDAEEDNKSIVQKFRVKLLAENGDQSTIDVLCQIGLDGIRMLDPNTDRILREYPLENITGCAKFDSSTLTFWSKSSVDIEPRRIRLQCNSYTINMLLDTVTAVTIQFQEMGGSRRPAESLRTNDQPTEKRKGFFDWLSLIKPANEEKDHWVPDDVAPDCKECRANFGAFVRRHHCRNCGEVFCDKCTLGRIALTAVENARPVRVCDQCLAEVTQRLINAKESSSKPVLQSHEELTRNLQEELKRNRKTSGSKSDGSGKRVKEVACPICTVHLQVEVPWSGSVSIECGVCQHRFPVSAH